MKMQFAALVVVTLFAASASGAAQLDAGNLAVRGAANPPDGFREQCNRFAWLCERSGRRALSDDVTLKLARLINSNVNDTTPQVSDRDQYGRDNVWALPTTRGGDCGDIAMLKKQRLVSAGVAPEDLLIATVLDLHRQNHAVLILRTNASDYVLDNLVRPVKTWRETGYTFLTMENPANPVKWVSVLQGGLIQNMPTIQPAAYTTVLK